MVNYVAGWNMLGYSSDPDTLLITSDYYAAGEYLLDTLVEWSDHDSENEDDYDDDVYLSVVSELESQRASGAEIHVTYGDYHLWVTVTSEEPGDE